jgi:zinc finger protein
VVDDPSGNSFIKNPYAPNVDKKVKIEKYLRSVEQLVEMGYSPENAQLEFEQKMEQLQKEKQEKEQK